MEAIKLDAEVRDARGKGPARRLRMSGKIPAVVYAKGNETTSVAISPKEFTKIMLGPLRRNTLIDLQLSGSSKKVMVRDVQKDPLRRVPTHVDFWQVDEKAPVVVPVPFGTTGRSKAVVLGAKLDVVKRAIRVKVLPTAIPEIITVDVTDLGQGAFRAKDVPMPAGCELVEDGHLTVLTISRPRGAAGEGEGEAAAS